MPRCVTDECRVSRTGEVFSRFLRLGLTSFGGPVAHLGYFRREFVGRAEWLDDAAFAEIVALCSVLPGPTSSQVGIAIGMRRAGAAGAVAAWLAFTTPSALALAAFGIALRGAGVGTANALPVPLAGALDGLAGVAAAVVALAVIQLARALAATPLARGIAVGAFATALALDRTPYALQWVPLALGGALGGTFGTGVALPRTAPPLAISRRAGTIAATVFAIALASFAIVAPDGRLGLFATFFRAGSLVFGGGHVVLPFLRSLVADGAIAPREFVAGYGAAQAMPGPLFAFAAFAGAVDRSIAPPALGALVATLGAFAPSFLLVVAAVPLWQALRDLPRAPPVLAGLGAAVVGLLAAAFVDPIGTTVAHDPLALAIAACALPLLAVARAPAWLAVVAGATIGAAVRTFARV